MCIVARLVFGAAPSILPGDSINTNPRNETTEAENKIRQLEEMELISIYIRNSKRFFFSVRPDRLTFQLLIESPRSPNRRRLAGAGGEKSDNRRDN